VSPALKIEAIIGALIIVFGGCAILWGLWAAAWDIYDYFMQQRIRRRNAQFDARVGRDCYRDTKGITR
jgi:hypothetical protein